MAERLRWIIRTPREAVLDEDVRGVRIPTESGQAGVRPGAEPLVLVVEAGLILIQTDAGTRFAATAGGLLESDRERCILYTPFAVTGERDADVLSALDRVQRLRDDEISARRRLGELEKRIVREVRRHQSGAGPGRP
jgi:F0F1-type ATP synthase epsilon subunit